MSDDDSSYDLDGSDDLMSEDDAFFDDALEVVTETDVANYRCLTPAHIVDEQNAAIARIADLFAVPPTTARLLLTHYTWNEAALIERYYEDEERVYHQSGIANPKATPQLQPLAPDAELECTICFGDYRVADMVRITCGHLFCHSCWAMYLAVKINDGIVTALKCPAKGCNLQLDSLTITTLLQKGGKGGLLSKYNRLVADAYVNDSQNVRWCPGKGCVNAVRVEILKEKEVVCDCGTRFCFGCGALPHAPCECKMIAQWNAKCARDGDDLKWMAEYTKECPKCKFVIHKDGGCQYMTCGHCHLRFCWMCLGEFDHTSHSCNKLAEDKDPTSERAQLNKFIHFYTRYQMHQQSIDLEEKLMGIAEKTMQQLAENGAAWIDVQYIKQSTLALLDARGMLKYTYIYGFYLPSHVNRSIFEYLQADLEAGVERLSGMLEAPGDKDRLKIINAAEYVRQRQKNLLEALVEGEIGGLGGKDDEQNYRNTVQKYDGWVYNAGS